MKLELFAVITKLERAPQAAQVPFSDEVAISGNTAPAW